MCWRVMVSKLRKKFLNSKKCQKRVPCGRQGVASRKFSELIENLEALDTLTTGSFSVH